VPPRKKTPPGPPPLTDAEVAALGSRLKAGEKPRVIVRSASAAVPAGTRGNIIRLGNPKDGDYVVVRLGRDEVPFAPAELSLSTRGGAAKASPAPAPAAAQKKTAAATSRRAGSSARSTAKATKSAAAKTAKAAPARSAPKAAAPAKGTTAPAKAAATRGAAGAGRGVKRATRRGKGRSPQPLTVTLRFSDSRWTVEAQRGSRRIARAMPLRPAAVSAFAEHVDEQAVRDALVETVESCRAVVEEQAAALRAELQAAESALREYDARRR
jgi:hypothetical protein